MSLETVGCFLVSPDPQPQDIYYSFSKKVLETFAFLFFVAHPVLASICLPAFCDLYPSRSILLIFRMLTSLYKHTRVEAQSSTMYGTESRSNGARTDEGGLAHARLSLFNRGALDCIDRCQDKNVPNKCAHSITGNVQVVDSGREAQKVNALRLSFPFT